MQFDYVISHIPGKLLYTVDTLSYALQECLVRNAELADLTEEQMTILPLLINFPPQQKA